MIPDLPPVVTSFVNKFSEMIVSVLYDGLSSR